MAHCVQKLKDWIVISVRLSDQFDPSHNDIHSCHQRSEKNHKDSVQSRSGTNRIAVSERSLVTFEYSPKAINNTNDVNVPNHKLNFSAP